MKSVWLELDGTGFWGKFMAVLIALDAIVIVVLAALAGGKVTIKVEEKKP